MTIGETSESTPIKVFISYAWTDRHHTDRVRRLADYLRIHGIDAILDQYHLRPGMDTDRFMEQVAQQHVQKVIAVCDANYVQKANNRTGGVGKEGSIMSQHVYSQLMEQVPLEEQDHRFVAVIFGLTDGVPKMPAMFGSSMYIDMSTEEKYDTNLDQLMRFLLDKPELVAPPIGKIPAHLRATPTAAPPTWASAQAFRRAVEDGRRIDQTFRVYLDDLLNALRELPPAVTNQQYDYPKALNAAEDFLPIRNEFVELMRFAARNSALNTELLGEFFEESINDTFEPQGLNRSTLTVTELVRAELMLYLTAICIKERQESVLLALTDRTYFIRRNGIPQSDAFGAIYYVSNEFRDAYNHIKNLQLEHPEADWLRERATLTAVTWDKLQEADLLLTIKSRSQRLRAMKERTFKHPSIWYAPTARSWAHRGPFDLFARFASRRVMDRWLPYFNVENKAEFQSMIQETLGDSYFQMTGGWGAFQYALSLDSMGTVN